MKKFSDRVGATTPKEVLQLNSIDRELRNFLWNAFLEEFLYKWSTSTGNNYTKHESAYSKICRLIWRDFYKNPMDEIPQSEYYSYSEVYTDTFRNYMKDKVYTGNWFEIYNLIEFCLININHTSDLIIKANKILEAEKSGYRIIENRFVPITSEAELETISESVNHSNHSGIVEHLNTAIQLFSNRENPDYRNSIKESISAVESLCVKLTNNPKAKFGDAIKELEKNGAIPGSLKTAFSALYGYTSDSGGIRHKLIDDENYTVEFDEAKFMLVSCSAFINFVINKINKST